MHRNTFILVAVLGIIAALVIGVNIGRKTVIETKSELDTANIITNQQSIPPIPSPTPSIVLLSYSSSQCGITFSYPATLSKLEADAGAAVFIDTQNPGQSIAVTCQADIPRPPLKNEFIETISVGSISAKLYHDASEKDGEKMDKLIFEHPKTKLDTFISGYGTNYQTILRTLTIH